MKILNSKQLTVVSLAANVRIVQRDDRDFSVDARCGEIEEQSRAGLGLGGERKGLKPLGQVLHLSAVNVVFWDWIQWAFIYSPEIINFFSKPLFL